MTVLLVAGAGLVAVGALTSALVREPRCAGLWVQAAGAVVLGAVGGWALVTGSSLGSGFTTTFTPRLGIDPLTGAFLLILALVGVPALVFAAGYLRPDRGRPGHRRAQRAVRARPRRCPLRPRPALVPLSSGS